MISRFFTTFCDLKNLGVLGSLSQLPKIFLPVLAEGEPDTAGVREGVEAHGGKLDDIAVAELGVGGEGVVDGLLEGAAQH